MSTAHILDGWRFWASQVQLVCKQPGLPVSSVGSIGSTLVDRGSP